MMFDREGGYRGKVRSYYLPGNTPAPPPAHRAYGSTSNAAEELINLTHLLFSARGGGAPPVEEGGYMLRLDGPPQKQMLVYVDRIVPAAIVNSYRVNDQISFKIPLQFMKK